MQRTITFGAFLLLIIVFAFLSYWLFSISCGHMQGRSITMQGALHPPLVSSHGLTFSKFLLGIALGSSYIERTGSEKMTDALIIRGNSDLINI